MVAGSFTREQVSAHSRDRIWKAGILDGPNLLPKLLPDFIASAEVEGGQGVGSVTKFNFTEAVKEYRFVKDKTELLDNENYTVKQVVLEGGLIGLRLKSYSYEMKLEAGNNGETLGKIKVEYDTLDDTPLSAEEEEQVAAGLLMMIKAIEGYLHENPTAYA